MVARALVPRRVAGARSPGDAASKQRTNFGSGCKLTSRSTRKAGWPRDDHGADRRRPASRIPRRRQGALSYLTETAVRAAAEGASLPCPANNMLPLGAAEKWKHAHNAVRGERCREAGLWLMSADVTGERDECVACGPTAVLNPAREVAAQLPLDQPGLLVFDLPIR